MATSAAPDFYTRIEIHDREFQHYAIEARVYFVPVDEDEEDRLAAQHEMFHEIFGQRHFLPDVPYTRGMRILDCGYGQGSWAFDMASMYAEGEVTAVDVFPTTLPDQPTNLDCQIWDLNDSMTPTYNRNHYDFIHSRCVGPGIRRDRWSGYIRDMKTLLKPNGWVQVAEYYHNIQSDSGRLTQDHALYKWGVMYRGLMHEHLNRDPRVGPSLADKLRHRSFRHVRARCFRIPIGDWPTDPEQRSIGSRNLSNIDSLLDSHAIWPFTHVGARWSKEQVGWLTDEAKREARDPNLKLYIELYVAWGQK